MTILTGCDDYNFDIPPHPFLLLDSYNVNFDQKTVENGYWRFVVTKNGL